MLFTNMHLTTHKVTLSNKQKLLSKRLSWCGIVTSLSCWS